MNNKEFISEYIKFKEECVEQKMIDLKEIRGIFKIKKELEKNA